MPTNLVRFEVAGPAKIAAVDNGNAASLEPFQADHRAAFHGHGARDCPVGEGIGGDRDRHSLQRRTHGVRSRN